MSGELDRSEEAGAILLSELTRIIETGESIPTTSDPVFLTNGETTMSVPVSREFLQEMIVSAREAERYFAELRGRATYSPDEAGSIGFGEIGDDEYFGH